MLQFRNVLPIFLNVSFHLYLFVEVLVHEKQCLLTDIDTNGDITLVVIVVIAGSDGSVVVRVPPECEFQNCPGQACAGDVIEW